MIGNFCDPAKSPLTEAQQDPQYWVDLGERMIDRLDEIGKLYHAELGLTAMGVPYINPARPYLTFCLATWAAFAALSFATPLRRPRRSCS